MRGHRGEVRRGRGGFPFFFAKEGAGESDRKPFEEARRSASLPAVNELLADGAGALALTYRAILLVWWWRLLAIVFIFAGDGTGDGASGWADWRVLGLPSLC